MSIENSHKILSLQLEWVKTADTKIPLIFAINLAMLGVIVTLIKILPLWTMPQAIMSALCLILLILSVIFLALSMFPRLSGPKGSIIFFGGIAKKAEDKYIDEVLNTTDIDYEKDLLSQAYRNAEIAEEKYKFIKFAFIASFISTPFWLISIFMLNTQ